MLVLTSLRDQELRFTVHDSPDYYQLKVSVFNDDKKTEIIGEAWVNLQDIVVPGGGQNDLWHNLNCKGKYAGEIRLETTYYDTRPKQEKTEKTKQASANGVEDGARDSLKGPRQPKAPVKRRPLPSDPVTGAPAPQPIEDTPPRGYQPQPPSAIPEHVQTPSHGYQSPNYIPNQSPLQNVEYNTPPHRPAQGYGDSPTTNGYGGSPRIAPSTPAMSNDRYETYDHVARSDYTQGNGIERYVPEDSLDLDDRYDTPYQIPQEDDYIVPPSPEGPPPPPPAHRSRNGSQQASPAPPMQSHDSYGFSSDSRQPNPYETPPHDTHRRSMPAHTHSNSYQSYSPPANDQFRKSANGYGYEHSQPRHHSYDSRYNDNYDNYVSMQPTVEDAPPTPGPGDYSGSGNYSGHSGRGSRVSEYDEGRYDQAASPAPLNLSGRGSAASGRHSTSTSQSHLYSMSSNGYGSNSPTSFAPTVSSQTSFAPTMSSQTSYSTLQSQGRQRDNSMGGSLDSYSLPQVPASLVPGMDPAIAQEISDRIYAEKRASVPHPTGNSPRGRYDSPQYQPPRPHPLSYQEAAQPFVPAAASYDDRHSRIVTATTPIVKPRAISPDSRAPVRKSVSPSPSPGASPDHRRLSGVPFGPDSYNALNPITSSASTPSLSARYDPNAVDPDAKIITHDGREIDPSDHIPESNYAPLLEPKGPKYASQQPDRNYRPPPVQQPMQPNPNSGRKQLRQAGRPHSMAASSPIYMNNAPPEPLTPQTGRNRLQKKVNRMSAQPGPYSSPLAPITPYQDNSYSPRSLPRANAGDYSNENYAPQHYGSSPGYRGSVGPPPIPAKVPMPAGPPAPQQHASGGDAWALLEEMKNIDLGSGRARRRGY